MNRLIRIICLVTTAFSYCSDVTRSVVIPKQELPKKKSEDLTQSFFGDRKSVKDLLNGANPLDTIQEEKNSKGSTPENERSGAATAAASEGEEEDGIFTLDLD